MSLRLRSHIELPAHASDGGFDHAAVHHESSRLYVAHTSNDDVDVIDSASNRFLRSIHGLKGVAGVLVSDERGFLFTANRAENTISIFAAGTEKELARLSAGIRPNGLAFEPSRGLLLVANVGDPEIGNSSTVSMIDVGEKTVIATVVLPGRTTVAITVFSPTSIIETVDELPISGSPTFATSKSPRDGSKARPLGRIPAESLANSFSVPAAKILIVFSARFAVKRKPRSSETRTPATPFSP